ncbi:thioredoxin domain-containing protein [bacterium]|nr:thioredoxin domain-containing protein [bacterium]
MTVKDQHTNRLINSTSPYLLQHAHNPVDWYPWGEAAFERARSEDKPIFLSIGYSTCHWCHVMAHESFEDEEVARLMNEHFICIKVDREERPDIDQLYMSVATALTGRGGWPLTIVMTPEKRPFFAGTYFPKISAPGRIGMLDLLPRINQAWHENRAEIDATSDQIIQSLQQQKVSSNGENLNEEVLNTAASEFSKSYDKIYGGFGSAPKFPSPHNLVFLLREGHRTGKQELIEIALHTLKQMRLGGIFDHIGYGFHRYSTDGQWHVPHFEKMLYDQATLMLAYTEAWQISGDAIYKQTVDEIFLYLTDKLLSPNGAYFSAEDADSDGEEGKFYVWSWDELKKIIGDERLERFSVPFDIQAEGNFMDEASGKPAGTNIFHLSQMDAYTTHIGGYEWEQLRQKLYAVREDRIHPGLDDKILADWNGLILTALSRAARAMGDDRYTKAAGALAEFLVSDMISEEGKLNHMLRKDGSDNPGFLDDYSFVIQGLRNYYELSFDLKYLEIALELQVIQIEHFWDDSDRAFFFTAEGDNELFLRQKEIYDGAIPSGNSVAAENLYYLGRLAEKPQWEVLSMKIGETFSSQVRRAPRGFASLLQSVQTQVAGSKEIVITGDLDDLSATSAIINGVYNPHKLVLYRPKQDFERIASISGFLKYQEAINNGLTVYICEDYTCQQPVTDLRNLEQALNASN